jgi:dipeptidyl aminopeptidase/acylaminoacyl peptidase
VDQVFKTDAAGETAVQVTNAPFDVGAYKVAPDGKTIVVSQAVFPDCDTWAAPRPSWKPRAQKTTGVVHDRLFVRHWDTWNDGTQNHLYAVKLDDKGVATGAPVSLMKGFDGDSPTKPFGGDEDFTITPDSKSVAFSAKVAGKDEAWTTNYDLWLRAAGRLGQAGEHDRRQQGLGHRARCSRRRQALSLSGHEAPGLRGRPLRDHDA